jgi:hypothetical protein
VSGLLYVVASVLLAAALACARKIRRARTLEDGAVWLAVLAAAVIASAIAAILAGGTS